jgi:transcriptional regulator with XRE-family HTH domain
MHSKDNDELKTYLASRIRFERKKRGYSQEVMATLAGVSIRTYKRFEQSCNGGFDNFINILRVFDRLETLEKVFPPPVSSGIRSMTAIIEDLNKRK